MQLTTILSLMALFALASALPTARTNYANIVFHGAADAQYSVNVPLDGSDTPTNNVLSISSVSSSTINIASQCTLHTVDHPPALVQGPPGTWTVGPPQTITSISCSSSPPPPSPAKVISIEFQGADPALGAKYTLSVPLDGSFVPTNNALSISTIYTTFAGLLSCTFQYVDHFATLSKIGVDLWAVGPPQSITGIQCYL